MGNFRESGHTRIMLLMLYLTESVRHGVYSTGDVLFTSQTNNVDVRFTSDPIISGTGFGLNIKSIPCTERDNFPETDVNTQSTEEPTPGYGEMNHGCDESAQEVQIAAGEVLEGAIVTNAESDGYYPNYACQQWNIIASENEV